MNVSVDQYLEIDQYLAGTAYSNRFLSCNTRNPSKYLTFFYYIDVDNVLCQLLPVPCLHWDRAGENPSGGCVEIS
jgi:hypothetical protein